LIVIAALAGAGCGDVVYTLAPATVLSGGPLRGDVRVTVTGAPPLLRLRLDVANDDVAPWRVVPAAQALVLPDGGAVTAAPAPPSDVPPRGREAVALLFHLPPATRLAHFVLRWQVERAGPPVVGAVLVEGDTLFPTMPCGADADPYCVSGYAGGD
jgi:hypothetical protein